MSSLEAEEDPRYIRGQIYKIISPNIEKIYIGSTILPLDVRFISSHKRQKNCSSMHIINEGNASIELLYEYPCKNKPELEAEEGRMMQACRNDGLEVVKKLTSGAAAAAGGSKEYGKEYRKANKEKISENRKEYHKANKEKIIKQNAEYYKANKEKASEYNKNRLPRFKCICCNKDYPNTKLKRHQQTAKYNRNMMGLEDIRV